MPPRNDRRPWIKLFVEECLRGTIREELTPEERGVWYDFLVLAGANRIRGQISANEKQGMAPSRVAAILNVKENIISRCTGKFLEQGRITIDDAGVISIVNWDGYQYSSYDRQKAVKATKKPDAAPILSDADIEKEMAKARRESKEFFARQAAMRNQKQSTDRDAPNYVDPELDPFLNGADPILSNGMTLSEAMAISKAQHERDADDIPDA